MSWFEHAGNALYYTDEGTGPPVLLLHGWCCDSHDWSWQIPALRPEHRVIALDHRGHGRSDAPRGSYRPQTLADDAAALLDALGAGPAVVLGHSMGAVVSSALAVRRPELVRALMLVDPVYNIPDDLLGSLLPHIEGPAPALFAAGLFEQGFYTDSTPAFLRTWHRRRLLGTPDHVISGCLLGMYRGDDGIGRAEVAAGYLRDRRQPRLVVYVAEEAAAFERGLPRGPADEIQVWPGTGHFAHQEQSERFNRLMLTWLGRLPDAEGS